MVNEFEKMDKERVRKRPRMTWDEAPAEPDVRLLPLHPNFLIQIKAFTFRN